MEAEKPGTYAGVRFDEDTVNGLQKYIKDNDIPNAIAPSKMHCTLIYSKKHLPDYKPLGDLDPPLKGKVTDLENWKTQPDADGNTAQCLVLKFDCPELDERHKQLIDEHNAKHGYDEYITHVTLSYNIGDMDIKKLPKVNGTVKEVVIDEEYGEKLKLNYVK
jgi:hypothetical protein